MSAPVYFLSLKAMTLMEYLIKTGSERVAQQCRENIYAVQTLKDFQYIDRDGKDQVLHPPPLSLSLSVAPGIALRWSKRAVMKWNCVG